MKQVASLAACLTFLAIAILVARNSLHGSSSEAPANYPAGSNAISVLRDHGHPVPPLKEWWIEHPSSEEIIAALVPPARSSKSICVQRLWIPRDAKGWRAVDETLLRAIEKKPTGAHQLALCALYRDSLGQKAQANSLMQRAREWFWDNEKQSQVYCSFRSRTKLSHVLALDWIEWKDAEEFEKAFEQVQSDIEAEIVSSTKAGRNFHREGYWNATHPIESAFFLEQLLAICVCNVNAEGVASRWAADRLKHIGADVAKDPAALYSSFELANVLSVISRRGGGREFGQQEKGPGFGGYEQHFAVGGAIQLEALDTATNRKWELRNRNLYFRTRQIGLVSELDRVSARTTNSAAGNAVISILARFFRDKPDIGGRFQWSLEGVPLSPHLREFQALAGRPPTSTPPDNAPFTERVGSRWHYRQNAAKPDSTLRFWITNRDLDHFRVSPADRCMSFAVGQVGLIDGQANRCAISGALANGVALCSRNKHGEPNIASADFWLAPSIHSAYHSPKRATHAAEVIHDPYYLLGTDGPREADGKWRWSRDYTDAITRDKKAEIAGKVQSAKFDFEFDPKRKRIQITDTVRADKSVYVGWHFSPTHRVKLTSTGFEFGDGKDEIRVVIEGLDGTELEVKRRNEWLHDGYTLPLEWHEKLKAPKRIAENVGYTPSAYRDEYRVRVVIQANP